MSPCRGTVVICNLLDVAVCENKTPPNLSAERAEVSQSAPENDVPWITVPRITYYGTRCYQRCGRWHRGRSHRGVYAPQRAPNVNTNELRAVESNSEVLLWQSRYRLGVVAFIGGAGFLLRLVGALGSDSVGVRTVGIG